MYHGRKGVFNPNPRVPQLTSTLFQPVALRFEEYAAYNS